MIILYTVAQIVKPITLVELLSIKQGNSWQVNWIINGLDYSLCHSITHICIQ